MSTIRTGAAALLSLLLTSAANAQSYPARPILMIVPYAAGGGTDILARHLAEGMGQVLGRGLVVENRPGAGTNIGGSFVARAEPDGYTLLMGDIALAANPSLFATMPYEPIKDLAPIARVAAAPLVLVTDPGQKFETVAELVAAAKASPGKLTFATAGNGNPPHLAAELFKSAAGIDLIKVPYRGVGPALTDVLGGRITMLFTGISSTRGLIEEGKVKALAVTSAKQTATLPKVPTIAAAGYPQLTMASWWGLFGPAKIPADIAATLAGAVDKSMANPQLREKLDKLNIDADFGAGPVLRDLLRTETERWGAVIKAANIKPD